MIWLLLLVASAQFVHLVVCQPCEEIDTCSECCTTVHVKGYKPGIYKKTEESHNGKVVYKQGDWCIYYGGHWKVEHCDWLYVHKSDKSQGYMWSKINADCPDEVGSQWRFYSWQGASDSGPIEPSASLTCGQTNTTTISPETTSGPVSTEDGVTSNSEDGWGPWRNGVCSASCGGGNRTDTRECICYTLECDFGSRYIDEVQVGQSGELIQISRLVSWCSDVFSGDETRTMECNTQPCPLPVNGGWSKWVPETCSVSCGDGTLIYTRECNNPEPKHGGNGCSGNTSKTEDCNIEPCPVVLPFTEGGDSLKQNMTLTEDGLTVSVPTHRNGEFQAMTLFIAKGTKSKDNMVIKIGTESIIMDAWFKPEDIFDSSKNYDNAQSEGEETNYIFLKKQNQLSQEELDNLDNGTKSFVQNSSVTRVEVTNVTETVFENLKRKFNSSNGIEKFRTRRDTSIFSNRFKRSSDDQCDDAVDSTCQKWDNSINQKFIQACWRWKNPVTSEEILVHNIVAIFPKLNLINCCDYAGYFSDAKRSSCQEKTKECCQSKLPNLCMCTDPRLKEINTDISSAVQCGVLCPETYKNKDFFNIGSSTNANDMKECQTKCENKGRDPCCGFAFRSLEKKNCQLYTNCTISNDADFRDDYTVCQGGP